MEWMGWKRWMGWKGWKGVKWNEKCTSLDMGLCIPLRIDGNDCSKPLSHSNYNLYRYFYLRFSHVYILTRRSHLSPLQGRSAPFFILNSNDTPTFKWWEMTTSSQDVNMTQLLAKVHIQIVLWVCCTTVKFKEVDYASTLCLPPDGHDWLLEFCRMLM